ncbi:MAG: type III-A CRISPR-associated protein Csm2 [Melioribacteraceae bacterium]|nr:MAG: type III-A CRISPR-associated protein Csm2 [Melioribacteraceae bacterium]
MGLKDLNSQNDMAKLTPEEIDSISENFGRSLADRRDGIKTNQVRNIFATVQSLRTKLKTMKKWNDELHQELVLIKPKLAYAAGRQRNVKPLYELLSKGIQITVNSSEQTKALENFIQLVESIVAYHKFHGGRDN